MVSTWYLNLVPFLPVLVVLFRRPTAARLMLAASLGFGLMALCEYLWIRLGFAKPWSAAFFDPTGHDPHGHEAAMEMVGTVLTLAAIAGVFGAALWIKQRYDTNDRRLTLIATSLILAATGIDILWSLWAQLGANPLEQTDRLIGASQTLGGITDIILYGGLLLFVLSFVVLPLYRLARRKLA